MLYGEKKKKLEKLDVLCKVHKVVWFQKLWKMYRTTADPLFINKKPFIDSSQMEC